MTMGARVRPVATYAALASAVTLVLVSAPARAQSAADPAPGVIVAAAPSPRPAPEPDGAYGRIDGDMAVVVGLGATAGPTGLRATGDLRVRYLDTVGLFATYEDGALVGSPSDPRRAFALGLEVRPLFLARWLKGREFGSAYPDLVVDSLGLEVAAVFLEPVGASFTTRAGLQLGLGLEVPLFPRASGPFLGIHGGVRWSDAASSTGAVDGPSDRALYLSMTVAWHQFFGAHVVDLGDRAVR